MSKSLKWLAAVLLAFTLVAAACGDDDDTSTDATEAPPEEPAAEEPTEEPAAEEPTEEPAAEEPTEEPAAEEPTEEPAEVDEVVAAFDANDDGTVTIGVAAAGPRDDGAYYQSVVDFAEEFSSDNGFAAPIVVDNIQAADAATEMTNLAEQGVDIIFVGASEIAEPLPDLTEQFPDIFWYCNCGAGFQELPGLAQTTDWGAAIHYTAGVAMGEVLKEQGGTKAVFLGCCDLNFEQEAYNATVYGMQTVDPAFEMVYVPTGDFQFDFDNSANATAALTNQIAEGATLAYGYLGGALDPVGQLATDEGIAVFHASGAASVCDREDGIDWTGTIAFDGGDYAREVLPLIISGDLAEGETFQFDTTTRINGAVLCDPTDEQQAALDASYDALASDGELLGALGAISGEAYGG